MLKRTIKILKKIGLFLLALIIIILGVFYYSISNHVTIGEYEKLYVKPTPNPKKGSVTIQFVGVSTMVISDDTTTIMTDGFFTRLRAMPMLFGKAEPKVEDIKWGVERLGMDSLQGIFVVHSHFDHAMDAPEVAKITGATMYGSASTANVGRGWGLDEQQIKVFKNREPIKIGNFTITPILSEHYEFASKILRKIALDGHQYIDEPLVPPVPVGDYKMGGAYTLLIEHPKGSFLIQSSAGWLENSLDSIQTDVVLLGIGGLGAQTEEYQSTYFKEIVDKVAAKQVYLIHWDGFVGSIREPIKGSILFTDWLSGNTKGGFAAVEREVGKREGVKANLLPQWEKVVLFE